MQRFAYTLLISLSALATTTAAVVDPDAFAVGTNISAAFPGVTLSAVGGGFGAGPDIFSVDPTAHAEPFNASTGRLTFGTNSSSFPHLFREPGFLEMRVDFANPAKSVSLDYIGNNGSDTGVMRAFNSSDVQVGNYTTVSLTVSQFETMTITRPSPDIAYVLAGGNSGGSSGGLDHLRYVVPEPSTFALAALGLLGMGYRRRRQLQFFVQDQSQTNIGD